MIEYRKPWRRQPDRIATLAPEWSGVAVAPISGRYMAQTADGRRDATVAGTLNLVSADGGLGVQNPTQGVAAARYATFDGPAIGSPAPENGAAVLVAFATTSTQTDRYFGGLGSTVGASGNTLFAIKNATGAANNLSVAVGNAIANDAVNFAGTTINDGRMHVGIVSIDRFNTSGSYQRRTWLDGVLLEDVSDVTVLGASNAFNYVCANGVVRGNAALAVAAASTNFLTVGFRRHLSIDEGIQLSLNPWQLFKPRRIFVPQAGIVLPTLSALPPLTPGQTSATLRYSITY